jgi:hypothetical protein
LGGDKVPERRLDVFFLAAGAFHGPEETFELKIFQELLAERLVLLESP